VNPSEVAILLGVVGTFDLRIQVDELKVRAWCESLDSDIPLDEAKMSVYRHYSNTDVAITVSHINKSWRMKLANDREQERGRRISLEIESAASTKAPPEVIDKYMSEIRSKLKGKNASVENGDGEMAPDL
jgi:hypothetical protein